MFLAHVQSAAGLDFTLWPCSGPAARLRNAGDRTGLRNYVTHLRAVHGSSAKRSRRGGLFRRLPELT